MTMYLVYKTDNLHSFASRDVIGVATLKEQAIYLCTQKAKKEGNIIDKDQSWNLYNLNQTQGYSGNGEFDIEQVETNKLL